MNWECTHEVTVDQHYDDFDFEMHHWSKPRNWVRNIETFIDKTIHGSGTPYWINFRGSAEITPTNVNIK